MDEKVLYYVVYGIMLVSFLALSLTSPDPIRGKFLGFLLTIANGIIFWR